MCAVCRRCTTERVVDVVGADTSMRTAAQNIHNRICRTAPPPPPPYHRRRRRRRRNIRKISPRIFFHGARTLWVVGQRAAWDPERGGCEKRLLNNIVCKHIRGRVRMIVFFDDTDVDAGVRGQAHFANMLSMLSAYKPNTHD